MSEGSNSQFINWDEATALVRSEPDKVVERLLSLSMGTMASQHIAQSNVPDLPVDTRYLIRLLREVFAHKETIRAVLDGKPAGEWFNDQ
jgi:hypothetical protein